MNTWQSFYPIESNDPWELSVKAGAHYKCPKDACGGRLGPMVPYSGKGTDGRNMVGDEYYNFAKVEEHPRLVRAYAGMASGLLNGRGNLVKNATTIVGLPEGGRTFGYAVAEVLGLRFVYPRKVPRPKSNVDGKSEYDFVFDRMELTPDDVIIVCDDVFHHLHNVGMALNDIYLTGAKVIALCSVLNRSHTVSSEYVHIHREFTAPTLDVVSIIRKSFAEYEQTDPAIREDVEANNIEFEVKKQWSVLQEAMWLERTNLKV